MITKFDGRTMNNTDRANYASRTGARSTVFEVKRDPILKNKNLITNNAKEKFPFVQGSTYKGQWKDNQKEGFGVQKVSG